MASAARSRARCSRCWSAFTPEAPDADPQRAGPARRAVRSRRHTGSSLELVGWGALERGADGRYRIGLRLWEIASLAPRGLGLREAAMPFLEDLYEVTHENVQLAVREGLEVVFVERIAGRKAVPVLTRVGGRFALHATGVGLVLLAHAPAEIQEELLAAPLHALQPRRQSPTRCGSARSSPTSAATATPSATARSPPTPSPSPRRSSARTTRLSPPSPSSSGPTPPNPPR